MRIGFVLLFSGIGLTVLMVIGIRRGKASKSCPSVQGKITGTSLEPAYDDEGDLVGFIPRVHYEYEGEGERNTNNKYAMSESTLPNHKAQAFIDRFHEGEMVQVFYNPEKPYDSMLVPGNSNLIFIMRGVSVVLAIVGLVFILEELL